MLSVHDVVDFVRFRITGRPPGDHAGPLPYVPRRPTTNPILPVDDMSIAGDFYRSLGFEVNAYDDGYAWIKHCSWEFFHLRLIADLDPERNATSAYIHVDDADEWHSVFTEASGQSTAVGRLVDQPWGMREFELVDPAGNLVRFGQHR